ncbi:MAG: type I glyceraldehyde-3-phosphate dehydrogenase [Parcubacteria group bacterium RIFCSPLOWO2_01_FULL_40_65]|nr:MAG: type I glyceraldehyde-3-phosphate dehydrogenase [Parcubacteria group bacterium RIFCSPHIGHO2_01_FULL_40_30]OHB19489.1 MAG: type I glyceraldehyde-3-phosphate dehydrogenase [Parcubacteria group bacterium RIFCSPHIGHO2_02_FULL_40_12]OHB22092.1 MAG: type I glyceraldehyde-3-phosphate dehydrogenase [Parcubacteria group bacterium RIFCSPLOWO2_01_FULL_40_65]OHB23687.1 MAG: type I glyceraldehyde-3-phosphate dehydrogenase [Parcubacteria group bacterium RIFCSPLOWO2_02_FULL_40_12]OHB24384.1 MAG: type 
MVKIRVAINGFGRIGRAFLKSSFGRKAKPELEFIAINDLGDLEQLAHFLKYDSVYGRWDKKVEIDDGSLVVEGKKIKFFQEKELHKLPWHDLNIDIVLESTGAFESFEKAKVHLDAGAKRVVISAPAKDEDNDWGKTVLLGANNEDLKTCTISSNGSCTTNSAHPVMAILSETLGIKKAFLVSSHGYTATQNLIDGPTKSSDMRRGRAAGVNIVPSFTGATIAVERAVKSIRGRFGGAAFRVPVISGSISAITALVEKPTTIEEVNGIFRKAENEERWKGIMKTTSEEIVSTDIIGEPHGAVVDLSLTSVVDSDLVAVFSWYDNEAGYTETLVRHVLEVARTF